MSFWKSRADVQDRYRRELFTGTVTACNSDDTYDIALPGVAEPVRGVVNASDIQFQEGNRVVLTRVGGRCGWQIHAGMAAGAPTRAVHPQALIDAPPLAYWGGLGRSDADAGTIAAYVDGKRWSMAALEQSGATDGQVPQWSESDGAWVPGDAGGAGLSPDALLSPVAAALAGLIAGVAPPLAVPPCVGAWLMTTGGETEAGASLGAFAYQSTRIQAIRAGAYPSGAAALAYWKLDETSWSDTALDCSGHMRDLTPHNLYSGEASGFYWARQLDGATSYLDRPVLPVQDANQLSIELWIKPHTLASNPMLFYQAGSASLQFEGSGYALRMYVVTGSGAVYAEAATDPAVLCDGNWHYLAGVYDGAHVHLYVDGVAAGTTPAQSGNMTGGSAANCFIGVYAPGWTGPSRFYDGFLDEIRVSGAEVTAAEIAHAWDGRDTRQAVTAQHISPVAWSRVMIGDVAVLNGGAVDYAVSPDLGESWVTATPWTWTTVASPGTHWQIRVTLSGRAEITRLGMVGMP